MGKEELRQMLMHIEDMEDTEEVMEDLEEDMEDIEGDTGDRAFITGKNFGNFSFLSQIITVDKGNFA